jgi:threonine/homoserine/homoserine lactone efflux protein
MDFGVFVRGVALGFSIAAPVGPIGLLVIRRALAEGHAAGLATGLGAATADAVYGAVAGLGLTAVAAFLAGGSIWLRIAGGVFLCVLGVRAITTRPPEEAAAGARTSLARAFASTFALTLTNPMTIMSFAAIIASVGLGTASAGAVAVFVAAVFAGSALWWVLLSGGVGLLRSRVTPRALRWVNAASGLMLVGFGVVAVAGAVWSHG